MIVLKRLFKYLKSLLSGDAKLESFDDTSCVCVGVQTSAKYSSCPGAGLDAKNMQKLLSEYGRTTLLMDSAATASAVAGALQEACRKKLCIFFYSGHGGRVPNPKAQDGSGYSEHLCLYNGALYDYTIWQIISQAKGRVVMVFDCCHSATMFRTAGKSDEYSLDRGFPFSLLGYVASGPVSPAGDGSRGGPNILVWSGCPSGGYSYGSKYGGVLTNAILAVYGRRKTYDRVWDGAYRRAKSQSPVRTVVGKGFAGRVFR